MQSFIKWSLIYITTVVLGVGASFLFLHLSVTLGWF